MSSVIEDLSRWGPEAAERPPLSPAEADAYCRRLARSHYENFPVASLVLPRRLRQHFSNVYAYCRWSDDLGDETGDPQRSVELLAWWRGELKRCFAGDVSHPVFVSLRRTVTEFGIPQQPFADLISAFEQDQHVLQYDSFEQLLDYCTRSADPVGRIVLHLCRAVNDQTLSWSDSICTGLQLANFWQDVARDAAIGRVYLPQEDRNRFGYSDDELRRRTTNEAFVELMRFEVDRARQFLECGRPLVTVLRGRMRIAVEMFVMGGLQILSEIERINYQVWDKRPVVSKRQFARMFAASVGRAVARPVGLLRSAN